MISKAINKIKYWGQLIMLPVYWLSFITPRSKYIWLFGSTFGRRFADNPRYLYLYASQHKDEFCGSRCKDSKGGIGSCTKLRPIWISRSKEVVKFLTNNGYEAYYNHSLKGIWYCLRGHMYIFDNYSKDISFWLSGGAVKFNLWHGIPLKKIQADNIFDTVRHPKNRWELFKTFPRRLSDEKKHHYVLTTSKFMKPIFQSAFRTRHIFTTGYPRIDSFIGSQIQNIYTKQEKSALEQIKLFKKKYKGSKMIYYMPTFRDSEIQFFDVVNLRKFQKFLEENYLLFCIKLHPKSKLKNKFTYTKYNNILNIDADTDPYVFISVSDALVTDYSSIYFDYLFTGKPIIFFNYDLETYLKNSREMYFDYEEYTPGAKVSNQQDLEKELFRVKEKKDNYADQRELLKKKVFDYQDGQSSKRFIKKALELR